jgi:vacuolar-type H+-ATPase catalytic subunit A/Vma1
MPLPKLFEVLVEWVKPWVAEYISAQRQTCRSRAMPLEENQTEAMQIGRAHV